MNKTIVKCVLVTMVSLAVAYRVPAAKKLITGA